MLFHLEFWKSVARFGLNNFVPGTAKFNENDENENLYLFIAYQTTSVKSDIAITKIECRNVVLSQKPVNQYQTYFENLKPFFMLNLNTTIKMLNSLTFENSYVSSTRDIRAETVTHHYRVSDPVISSMRS